jgi:hypothetical protein
MCRQNFLTLLLNMKITVPSIVQLILVCLVSPSKGPGYISADIYSTAAALYAEPEYIHVRTACGLHDRSSITGTGQICLSSPCSDQLSGLLNLIYRRTGT